MSKIGIFTELANGSFMRNMSELADAKPNAKARVRQSQQALARARRSPEYVAPPTEDTLGLALRSEELALNLPQRVQRGDDLGRFMRKKGVTQQEIKALKLDELFKRDRVTQQELVDHIDQNRVRLEVTEYTGGKETDFSFGYEALSAEEAHGSDYLMEMARENIDYGGLFENTKLEDLSFVPAEVRNDRREQAEFRIFQANGLKLEDLSDDLRSALEDEAYRITEQDYNEFPIERITLKTEGYPSEYSLVGNEDTGYAIAFNEPEESPLSAATHKNTFEPVYSQAEAEAQLQRMANEDGFINLDDGETQYSDLTVNPEGIEGYRERLIQLDVPERRFVGSHYDDWNILASPRTSDKVGPNGEKILYVEEIQSDYAQQGRDRGFKNQGALDDADEAIKGFSQTLGDPQEFFRPAQEFFDETGRSPDEFYPQLRGALGTLNDSNPDVRRFAQGEVKLRARQIRNKLEKNATSFTARYIQNNPDFLGDLSSDQLQKIYEGLTKDDRRARAFSSLGSTDEAKIIIEREIASAGQTRDVNPGLDSGKRLRQLESVFPEGAALYKRMQGLARSKMDEFLVGTKGFNRGALDRLLNAEEIYGKKLDQFEQQELAYAPSPFVTASEDWNKLVAKDLILEADRGSYDQIAFAPSEAQTDRWREEGLKQQYDVNVPSAFRKAGGIAPQRQGYLVESDRGKQYDSPVIDLRQKGPDGLTPAEKVKGDNTLFTPAATTLGAGYLGTQAVPGFNEKASAVGEVAAAGLTSLAAPFLTGPSSFLESMNPAIPVDELERRRAARQDMVTSEIRSPLAQAYAEQAQQAVAPILQDINQNRYLNALPFDELYEYGSEAVKDLPARLRFMGGALLDSTGL